MRSIVLFSGFLCFSQSSFAYGERSLGKKAASRTPFAKGVLENLPKGRGIRAFEARMLHTHENFHNAPPTGRRGLFLCSLPAICRHGRLCIVVRLFSAPADGSAHRGDLVGMGVLVRLIPEHLCKPKNHGGETAGSWRCPTSTNVGVTSLHLCR